jgi:putative ABC transport system permease protein
MIRRRGNGALLVKDCILVAAANLLQHRLRLVAAVSGVAVALFLLTLQIAILDATRAKITQLFDDLRFDMAVVPDTYQFLLTFETINRVILEEARAAGGVVGTFGLNIDNVHWTELPSKRAAYLFLIGLDDPDGFVRDPAIRNGMADLVDPHSILIDADSSPDIGPVSTGTTAEIAGEKVHIEGQFKLGLFFYAEGSGIVRNTNFARLADRDPRTVSIGLLQLAPGVSPQDVKARLIERLPSTVVVMTREELLKQERAYFLTTKPIGIMLYISMVIAALVGVVIMIQILSVEVSTRLKEYAVLKAMGSSTAFVYGVGMAQATMLGLGGLVPALAAAAAVLWIVQVRTHLSSDLDFTVGFTVLAITLGLAAFAAAAVAGRIRRADPAELY